MNKLPKIVINPDLSQFIYAVLVVILVPALLGLNTIYLLKNVQKDMDFELNNKALMVQSVTALYLQDKLSLASASGSLKSATASATLQEALDGLVRKLPEIRAVEVFRMDQDNLAPLTSTSPSTASVYDPTLNSLAWGSDQVYSKQIYAAVGNGGDERIWLVAAPLRDASGKKVGILNIYLSAAQIDAISNSTTRDSLIILVGTMIVTLLLLLNHFRFFQISILFKKLSEIDMLKDDFISMASHELKGPITVINSYASVLMDNEAVNGDPEVEGNLLVISESTRRLRSLVDEVLDVTRIEQKRLQFNLAVYDLRELIAEVIEEYRPQAQSKKLTLTYQKSETPLPVLCDSDRMHQVISNLLSNAIKYTPAGGISVGHRIEKDEVKTFVKDTGIGISEKNRRGLFGKFFRANDDRVTGIYGTGLGLWITKQLVEKMGGSISMESMENQGSQFVVTFSLKDAKMITPLSQVARPNVPPHAPPAPKV